MPGLLFNRFNTYSVMKKAKIKIQGFSEITKTTGTFLVDTEGEQLTPTYMDSYECFTNVRDLYPLFEIIRVSDCLIDDQPLVPLEEINQKFIHLKMNL